MSDYYSILGLTKTASSAEIKAAYRKLVKIYHPDKNPNSYEAVEKFRQIQQAYETLIDPIARSKYDGKVSYTEYFNQHAKTQQTKQQTQGRGKKYSFTEEDLKKRQYYKEHYKQQYEASKKTNSAEEKKKYNETRYILMSIPLAIALLFFIINIYERSEKKKAIVQKQTTVVSDTTKIESKVEEEKISTSSEPYKYYFPQSKIDKNTNQVVQITNYSGKDAIVCVVDASTNKVVRHYYIENNFFLYFEYLPEGKYYLRNYLGDKFNVSKKNANAETSGAFENESQFQAFKDEPFDISLQKYDTLSFDIIYFKNNKSKNIIKPEEFFVR